MPPATPDGPPNLSEPQESSGSGPHVVELRCALPCPDGTRITRSTDVVLRIDDGTVLLGRDVERARLRAALDGARDGRGAALVLRGEAGIGKTALLEEQRSAATGFRILAARGIESESRLAFAGLSDLVRPVLDRVAGLPEAQRTALLAALALGPPAVPDRFAAYSATLGLLGELASDGPLLILVDDAQWLDVPSQEALLFCARRLGEDPVVMIATSREAPAEQLDVAGVEELRIERLDEEDARRLLAAAEEPLAPEVIEALVGVAGGNPLALMELPRALSPDQRAGRAALPRTLKVGEAVTRAFRTRVEGLGGRGRRAALLAAVSEDGSLAPITAALGAGAADDLASAEAAGLLVLTPDSARMPHPLLRPIVLEIATPLERRDAHRGLAEALDPERGRAARLASCGSGRGAR